MMETIEFMQLTQQQLMQRISKVEEQQTNPQPNNLTLNNLTPTSYNYKPLPLCCQVRHIQLSPRVLAAAMHVQKDMEEMSFGHCPHLRQLNGCTFPTEWMFHQKNHIVETDFHLV